MIKYLNESQFPNWYTIDEDGLDSLNYFLIKEYEGKTIRIIVEEEE